MARFAHIINPFDAAGSPDLARAQAITFETMRQALSFAAGRVDVVQLAACYAEDIPVVPPQFTLTQALDRSVLDFHTFQVVRRLPLLIDVLQRGYESSDAGYLIYSNSDIALQPHFYKRVSEFVAAGYDAFAINRRTISGHYQGIAEIPLMQRDEGRPHRGWDCFVFRRTAVPQLILGHVCIGAPRSGLALVANLEALAGHFHEFTHEHLTFHLGDDRAWARSEFADYAAFNSEEAWRVLALLEEQHGRFPAGSIAGSLLWRRRLFGPLYEAWSQRAILPPDLARAVNNFLRRAR